jgi:RNA polymerase sigma-70 factor (ECF subfamily)
MRDASNLPPGVFDARYLAFLETINHLRPTLHRYCSRMTGSVLDGEDVVQDALFQAFRKLDAFDDNRRLGPWLFRIAHNECIDFLRRRRVRQAAEVEAIPAESVPPIEPSGRDVGRAIEHLVLILPPKERACVLLKDVFDYSLQEVADLVGSTVGGVKAALNRARHKLSTSAADEHRVRVVQNPDALRLRDLYVERFNRHDWDGIRELIAADARVRVADQFDGPLEDAPYFARYDRVTTPWRLAPAEVDGESVIVVLERGADTWTPHAIVRFDLANGQIVHIVDYTHCPWVLSAASSVRLETPERILGSTRAVLPSEPAGGHE